MFIPFEVQPTPAELPSRFPSPFAPGPPHALAARAAAQTREHLAAREDLREALRGDARGGTMFGVLVVRQPDGQVGYLRAFAGALGGAWQVEGFVPPCFDLPRFEALWSAGGDHIFELDRHILELRRLQARTQKSEAELRERIGEQRAFSRKLHAELNAGYRLRNAKGERRALEDIFAPRIPPGGTGDCAAPKLLLAAYELGATPLALAEFWVGPPTPGGGRRDGVFYPACRGRCGVLLPFMLEGLECAPAPDVGMLTIAPELPTVLHEDEDIVVIDKPAGLLSVPGRGPRRQDSAERRLKARRKPAELGPEGWPRLVHRLDLATSGVIVAAQYKEAYVALQKQFSRRQVQKRYLALLRGHLEHASGEIDLPLRPDWDDRPRQLVDRREGKPARTRFERLGFEGELTRVALFPLTGRTHQLRLHAAHEEGLGLPIEGDRLYGFGGEGRLMLHAERLEFRHPRTGAQLHFEAPCPF